MSTVSNVIRATVAMLTVAVALVVAPSAAFGDAPYSSALSLIDATPAPGSQVTVRAGGLAPNRETALLFDQQTVATTTTDANGVASKVVTIPVDASDGDHVIAFARPTTGAGSDASHAILPSTSIDVQHGGSALTSSDGDGVSGFVVAFGAVGLIAVAIVVMRRRSARA